jgi:hypothetical protein
MYVFANPARRSCPIERPDAAGDERAERPRPPTVSDPRIDETGPAASLAIRFRVRTFPAGVNPLVRVGVGMTSSS